MFTFAQIQNLNSCDVIVTPKSNFRVVEHYVVYLGVNEFGQEVYIENNNIVGVRVITGDQFVKENPDFIRIKRFQGNEYQRRLALQRAISLIGTKYDLTNFNCEHFANHVQYSVPYSKQADNGMGFLAIGVLSLLAIAIYRA